MTGMNVLRQLLTGINTSEPISSSRQSLPLLVIIGDGGWKWKNWQISHFIE